MVFHTVLLLTKELISQPEKYDSGLTIMTIDEAFCQSVNGGFSRGITCRKGKSITRISIYSSKNKTLSFPRRKWSNVVNLPPGCWSRGIWSLEDDACATKGMAGEVTQALGGAQKIVSWIPDIGPDPQRNDSRRNNP